MSLPASVWRRLTDAPRAIVDPERRRQVQLLSGLVVVLVPISLVSIFVQLWLDPGFLPTFSCVAASLVLMLAAYGLGRTRHFTAGALLLVAVSVFLSFAIVFLNPGDVITYAFLYVSMFLARLLFNRTGVWVMTLVNLAGVLLVLPALGVPPPGNDPSVMPIFLVLTAALLLIAIRYRDSVELDRRAALAASKEFAESLVGHAPVIILVLDGGGRIVSVNRYFEALSGYRADEVVGRDWFDTMLPARDRDRIRALFRTAYAGTSTRGNVNPIVTRSGVERDIEWNDSVLRDAAGNTTGLLAIGQDVTERRRTEQALHESEELLSMSQSLSHLGSWKWQVGTGRVTWSDEMYRIYGVSPDAGEPTFESAMAFLHPDDRAPVAEQVQTMLAGKPVAYYECRIVRPDGAVRWVQARSEVRRHANGHALEVIGSVQDITERKRAEQAQRESEELLAHAQEVARLGSFDWNLRTNEVIWSRETWRLFGEDPDRPSADVWTVLGRSVHPDDQPRLQASMQRVVEKGERTPMELRVRWADGSEHVLWSEGEVICAADGRPERMIGTMQDITARKAAEMALRESEAMLARAQEMTHLGSWSLDITTGELKWSDEIFRIFEIDPARFTPSYDTFLATIHPEDRNMVDRAYDESVRNRAPYDIVHRLQMPDGRIKYVHERGETMYDGNGRPQRTLGTVQDISGRKLAEQALEQNESNFRALTENSNVGIFVNYRGRHVFANPRVLEMLGYTLDEVRNTTIEDLVHPDELDKVRGRFQDRMAGKPVPSSYETMLVAKDGTPVPVELTATLTTWQGEPAGLVFLHDIRERIRNETEMRKLSSAITQTADAVLITDRQGIVEYVNPAFEAMTGYARDELVGGKPNVVKSGKQGAGFYQKLWQTILAGSPFADVFVNRRKDGTLYYEEKTITPLKDGSGRITHFVATGRDITERMQTQERLQYMAQHDALTELPNRALFLDRLRQSVARARWHQRLVAVLFIDLDRFKTINDTLGHEAGDRLLQQLADRFRRSVRDGDTVARFGGDEFVILLDDVGAEGDIGGIAKKVLEALTPPFTLDGQNLYITASIGISLFPGDGEDSGTLLKNADVAMYRAKELGKNTYQFYSADMSARAFERLSLETSLRHALEHGEFRLYYQPQIDTDSGRIVAVEALLRWAHRDFGLVAPAEFIPLLEETGLIIPVGDWVLASACEQLRQWHRAGWKTLRMAVNLSPRQFQSDGVLASVESNIERLGCESGMLELEITEGMLLQHAGTTLETLEALRETGVRLAIDDFGTGWSSLAYLRRFPIDTLKIDRSFVHDIPQDPDDSAITTAIAALAASLKLDMVAEGVESEAQREFLRGLGCRVMQGNLFSRAVPPEDITALLNIRNPIK